MDLNDPELEFSDLVYAYQSWVIAVINDEKLNSKEKLLTEEISDDIAKHKTSEINKNIRNKFATFYIIRI